MKLAHVGFNAAHAVVATYSRTGFEAAAATALLMFTSATVNTRGVTRTAEFRFGHPYAVVAVGTAEAGSAWSNLPVFSAWVGEPTEAMD
jgi:hypothetical protein